MARKKQRAVYLSDDDYATYKQYAESKGVSFNAMIEKHVKKANAAYRGNK